MTVDTTKLTTILGRLMIFFGLLASYGTTAPMTQQLHDWAVFLAFACGGLAHSFSQGTPPAGQSYVTVTDATAPKSGDNGSSGLGPNLGK